MHRPFLTTVRPFLMLLTTQQLRRTAALQLRRPVVATQPPRRGLALHAAPRGDPRKADQCEATITGFGPLGASVEVELRDGSFERGLILQSELKYLREARRGEGAELGETLAAWAVASRDDGKLDVYLRAPTAKGKSDDAKALILEALEIHGGVLDVGDRSPSEDIAAVLPGLSKTVFKNAVGALFREGKVAPSRRETRLAAAAPAAAPDAAAPGKKFPVLFVGNIPFDSDWTDLTRALAIVADAPVRGGGLRRRNGRPAGCAHVEFGSVADATKALEKLGAATYRGRKIRVEWATDK